jgi:hypothetical protein
MHRLVPRLFTLASAVSFVMCVAVCALWVRGYRYADLLDRVWLFNDRRTRILWDIMAGRTHHRDANGADAAGRPADDAKPSRPRMGTGDEAWHPRGDDVVAVVAAPDGLRMAGQAGTSGHERGGRPARGVSPALGYCRRPCRHAGGMVFPRPTGTSACQGSSRRLPVRPLRLRPPRKSGTAPGVRRDGQRRYQRALIAARAAQLSCRTSGASGLGFAVQITEW